MNKLIKSDLVIRNKSITASATRCVIKKDEKGRWIQTSKDFNKTHRTEPELFLTWPLA